MTSPDKHYEFIISPKLIISSIQTEEVFIVNFNNFSYMYIDGSQLKSDFFGKIDSLFIALASLFIFGGPSLYLGNFLSQFSYIFESTTNILSFIYLNIFFR